MDLQSTSFSTIKIDALQSRVDDILGKLQQAGLFRALVIETKGNRVLLDTAFGQLKGVVPDKLAKGDEIYARLLPGKANPSIKVEQVKSSYQALPDKIVNQLIKVISATPGPATSSQNLKTSSAESALTSQPQIIKVISHTPDKTLIQLESKTYTIPRQDKLEAGETLMLKTSVNNKVELLRIQPENILKNALARLLPQVTTARQDNSGITDIQRLAFSLLRLKHADTSRFQTAEPTLQNKNIQARPVTEKVDIQHSLVKPGTINIKQKNSLPSVQSAPKEIPLKVIEQYINSISRPMASAENIKAGAVKQILSLLSLLKPTASINSEKPFLSFTDHLGSLHKAISHSPENFKLLLHHIIETNAATTKANIPESTLLDFSNSIKNEFLLQLEQTLTQLLVQKTTIRLHQEQNQPIQLNLNIPLQVNNETTALKLKIKQRNNHETNENQHWEINLQFEFGLLGLITTNILLQDTKLSAHFWAVKSSTRDLIDSQLGQFKDQLKKSGFELGLFDCFIGEPASDEKMTHCIGENLVDINV